jgi:hypothetical protein
LLRHDGFETIFVSILTMQSSDCPGDRGRLAAGHLVGSPGHREVAWRFCHGATMITRQSNTSQRDPTLRAEGCSAFGRFRANWRHHRDHRRRRDVESDRSRSTSDCGREPLRSDGAVCPRQRSTERADILIYSVDFQIGRTGSCFGHEGRECAAYCRTNTSRSTARRYLPSRSSIVSADVSCAGSAIHSKLESPVAQVWSPNLTESESRA